MLFKPGPIFCTSLFALGHKAHFRAKRTFPHVTEPFETDTLVGDFTGGGYRASIAVADARPATITKRFRRALKPWLVFN